MCCYPRLGENKQLVCDGRAQGLRPNHSRTCLVTAPLPAPFSPSIPQGEGPSSGRIKDCPCNILESLLTIPNASATEASGF